MFQGVDDRIWLCITSPLHTPPRIGNFIFVQLVLAILAVLVQYSANLCFPSRNSVQSGLTPSSVLVPKAKYTVDVFHNFTLHGTSLLL